MYVLEIGSVLFYRQFVMEEGVPRLLYMTRQQHKHKPSTVKYSAAVSYIYNR